MVSKVLPLLSLLGSLWATPVFSLDVPKLTGPVVDLAGVLSRSDQAEISASLLQFKRKHGPQLQVLVVPKLEDGTHHPDRHHSLFQTRPDRRRHRGWIGHDCRKCWWETGEYPCPPNAQGKTRGREPGLSAFSGLIIDWPHPFWTWAKKARCWYRTFGRGSFGQSYGWRTWRWRLRRWFWRRRRRLLRRWRQRGLVDDSFDTV